MHRYDSYHENILNDSVTEPFKWYKDFQKFILATYANLFLFVCFVN